MKKMRIMVLALMAMAAGLLSGPGTAYAEGTTPEIVLGAGEIAKATSTARNYTVWFGKYNNNAIQWRVLSGGADSSLPVSGEGKALLISKDILATILFNWSSAAEPRNAWAGSNAQAWCTNFLANWVEGSAERAAISPTTVTETAEYKYNDTVNNYSIP